MPWNSEWDDVVDVVCTDAGIAGLCGAIAAVDADVDVFLACTFGRRTGWFPTAGEPRSGDADTVAYLTSLTDDIDLAKIRQLDADLPTRAVVPLGPPGKTVPPFYGSRLRNWAIRTIGSPTGYLYTRLTDWQIATVAGEDGEHLNVAETGPIAAGETDPIGAVHSWLTGEARRRSIRTHEVSACEALVLEGGVVVGAVFATQDGPRAVRAEHGVFVCGPAPAPGGTVGPGAGPGDLRIAMVSKAGSRFGRVEVLTEGVAAR